MHCTVIVTRQIISINSIESLPTPAKTFFDLCEVEGNFLSGLKKLTIDRKGKAIFDLSYLYLEYK